jgi:hypothetical protein
MTLGIPELYGFEFGRAKSTPAMPISKLILTKKLLNIL